MYLHFQTKLLTETLYISFGPKMSIQSPTDYSDLHDVGTVTSMETGENLGPEFHPTTAAEISLASTKILIGIIGFLGNFTVCIVVAKLRSQQNYANNLIVSQAMIDLLTSLSLIATTFTELFPSLPPQHAVIGYLFCVLWYPRTVMFSMFVISTFNLIAISVERYIAVVCSTWYRHHFSRKKTFIFVTLAWLLAPVVEITLAFTQFSIKEGKCFFSPSSTSKAITGLALFLWNFLLPCLVMAYCFTRITIKIQQQKKRVGASESGSTTQQSVGTVSQNQEDNSATNSSTVRPVQRQASKRQTRNVTKTLAFVFLVYVFCWAPNQLLFLQYNLGGYVNFGGVLHSLFLILAMFNTACNPFIYAFQYKQYRDGLKALFKFC